MNNNAIIVAGASVISTTAGALAGYFYAKKQLKSYYEEISDKEIQAAREFYTTLEKTGDLATPEQAVKKLIGDVAPVAPTKETVAETAGRAAAIYKGQRVQVLDPGTGLTEALATVKEESEPMTDSGTDKAVVTIIADEPAILVDGVPLDPDAFNLEDEVDSRRNGVPYVITRNEYDENPDGFDQSILTWFVHDSTLVDEDEKEIDAVERMVGRANLQRFGHGSGDPLVVFVRNEKEGMDFEILRTDANYIETTLGLTDEDSPDLRHSSIPPRRRRMSFDD